MTSPRRHARPIARTVVSLLLSLSFGLGLPPPASAQTAPAIEVSSALTITSSNARSRFDRRRREIISEVDLLLANTGQQSLSGPLWLVVATTSPQVSQPLASGAWAGPTSDWSPQRAYYDLSGRIGATGLASGQSVSVHLKFVRSYRVRFTYSNSVWGPDAAPANQPPVANAGPDQALDLQPGQDSLQVTLDARGSQDSDGNIVAYQWAGTPTPAAIAQPTVNLGVGNHVFSLVVTDDQGAASNADEVRITIAAANPHAPIVTVPQDQYTVAEGQSLQIPVAASDGDGDPVALSAAPGIGNTGFSASPGVAATGTLDFQPDYDQQGLYVLTFTGRDPLGYTGTRSVRVQVTNVNRPPTLAAPTSVSVDEGGLITIPVTATDPDDDPLTLTATDLPANALFIPATGTISFTPAFDQAGDYPVTVTVSDGSETVSADILITVVDVAGGGSGATALDLVVDPVETPTLRSDARITGRVNSQGPPAPAQTLQTTLITGLNPANGRQGETLEVVLSGSTGADFATHFQDGISQAEFGAGIQVDAIQVTSPSDARVTLSIAADADPGTRAPRVVTAGETAVSMLAFRVEVGLTRIGGVLLDPAGNPIAGVVITIEGSGLSTITAADGSFSFDLPAGHYQLIVNAPDHELLRIAVDAQVGEPVDLGDLEPAATVFDPSAPPAGTVFSVIGRGIADPPPDLTVEQAKQLIIDTIIAVGGSEAGVLDEYGNQLNPNVDGNGLVSLRSAGLDDLALQLLAGDGSSVAEILTRFLGMFDYQGRPVPTLIHVRAAIQQVLDSGNSPLFQVLFSQGRSPGGNPPELRLNTRLNAAQTWLMTSSLIGFVHNLRTAPDAVTQRGQPPTPTPIRLASAASLGGIWSMNDAGAAPLAPAGDDNGLFTIAWENVFAIAEPLLIDGIKSTGIAVCEKLTAVDPPASCGNGTLEPPEQCDGTPGCTASCTLAVVPTPPGCTEMADLVDLLISDQGDAVTGASEFYSDFFLSQGAGAAKAESIKEAYQGSSFQEAWEASRKEASDLGKLTEFVSNSADFIMDGLANIAGEMVGAILKMHTDLLIETMRPDPPLITKIEQLPDPSTGELSNTVRITFQRSLKDNDESNKGNEKWFYELWREHRGKMGRVTSGRVRKPSEGPGPRPTANDDTLVFYDLHAPEGTVLYRIRSVVLRGVIVTERPPSSFDSLLQMAGGLVPLDFATPGGVTMMGGDTLKMLLDPVADVFRGTKVQKSPFSDIGPFYVNLKPRPPAPPANLASDPHRGRSYVSIPFLGRIFKIEDGEFAPFADAGFVPPNQAGLAIDDAGRLYTDNAASDTLYSGRLFRFDPDSAGRSFVGSVNYYSLLLQFGHPAAVQALTIGPSPYGEALYIADAQGGRITQLRLPDSFPPGSDLSHNVSRDYLKSDELLFGAETAMVFRGDGTLFITQGNNIFEVPYGGGRFDRLFDDAFAPSPFSKLSGITLDDYGNLYVSDFDQHSIHQIPFDAMFAGMALKSYDPVDLKKLVIARGFVRPTQMQLAPDRRGLVFYDANGLQQIRFGMSGQVTDPAGTPLIAAKVIAIDSVPVHGSVTDGDGIYVLPDLVGDHYGVVDVTIRHDGRSQTQRVILNQFGHNVVDFVFDPPPPADGSGTITVTPPPSPPPPPIEVDLVAGETVVIHPETTLAMVVPPTAPPPGNAPPRSHLLSPGPDMIVSSDTARVQGFVTDPGITDATLIVNGERQAVTLSNGELDHTVSLRSGDNRIALEVKEGGAKAELVGAATQALADSRDRMRAVREGFGTGIGDTWGLAGQSLDAEFSQLPDGYRADSGLQARGSAVRDQAAAAVDGLLQHRLPGSAALSAISTQLAAIAGDPEVDELHRAATATVRARYDAAATRLEQTRTATGVARARVQTDIDQMNSLHNDVLANFSSGVDRDAITDAMAATTQDQQAYTSSYDQQQIPETLQAQRLQQHAQTLINAVDAMSGSMNTAQQATLANVRSLATSTDTQTRSDHRSLLHDVGDALGELGPLAGRSAEALAAQMTDTSITPEFRLAATDMQTAAQAGLTTAIRDGRLPDDATLAAIDARLAGMAQQATAAQSPLAEGLTTALQQRSLRARTDLAGARAAFSQGHGALSTDFAAIDAPIAAVQALGQEAVPPAFDAARAGLDDSVTGILDALDANRLPGRALVGDAGSGDGGALAQRADNLDRMFTVRSRYSRVRKEPEASAQALRDARGFDATLSGVLTERSTGRAVAGEAIGVPGQAGLTAATDRDGVFQVQIKLQKLNELVQQAEQLMQAKHDAMMSAIQQLRSGSGSAQVNEGLSTLILEAARVQDEPPAALAGADDIVARARRVEDLATSRLADVEAGRSLSSAQIDEMQAELQQMQAALGLMQGVLRTQHDSAMNIITNIR